MHKLGRFTIILPSYDCNKNCPFCISKNNKKFNNRETEDFNKLCIILEEIKKEGIRFEGVDFSGNGEPSLYSYETLKKYAEIIKKYGDIFDELKINTSGNFFWEKDKFELFNNLLPNTKFNILRVAIDSNKDMQVLGYKRDYLATDNFKKAKKIKLELALTKFLEKDLYEKKLEKFVEENPNIDMIRFKNLMSGSDDSHNQSEWVRKNIMSKTEITNFISSFLEHNGTKATKDVVLKNGTRVIFENSGDYPKDVVYSAGKTMDYNEQPISISKMKEMAKRIGGKKSLIP